MEGVTQSLLVGLKGPGGLQTHSEVPALQGKWHVVPLTDGFTPTLKVQPEPDCSHLRQPRQPRHPDPSCPCSLWIIAACCFHLYPDRACCHSSQSDPLKKEDCITSIEAEILIYRSRLEHGLAPSPSFLASSTVLH